MRKQAIVSTFCMAAVLCGCNKTPANVQAAQQEQARQIESARQDLQQIPPPSKHLYLNVQHLDSWQNPSLTVQEKMITLQVMMPDSNPSDLGKGTLLRPEAARKQVLNIAPEKLAEALNAIPREAWPYGRVVAIEEAHDAPAVARPKLRRNIEAAEDVLNGIGVVADEWSDGKPIGNR